MPPAEHLEASVRVLEHTLDHAVSNHGEDPKSTLLRPADHKTAHSWMHKFLPEEYVESLESSWHLGNYVIDRTTGEKHWEDMSIYVRIGMHLLYYGSEQENALHWQRTLKLLEQQSVKMGKEYDDPKSKDHIAPFVKSFKLENTLQEFKKDNIDDYTCFNEFFARELKDGMRPIDEAANDKVVSSPADCRLTAFPTIDLATKYWIKGFGFTPEKLLGSAELAQQFDGGTIVIARLAPQD